MSEMIELNWMICNKCFAPFYRGKRPYHVTQCGHISCQNCLQQVEQQCPQCQHGTMALALQDPLMPKLIPYFQPFTEIVEMQLMKVNMFRDNQMKILMHRFTELDKKYELLKTRFWPAQRNFKALVDKYTSVKNEKDKLEKKLMFYQTHRVTPPQSGYRGMEITPSDSGISVPTSHSSVRCSMESSDRLKSMIVTPTLNGSEFNMDITPMGSIDLNRTARRTADGLRFRRNRKPPQSMDSQNMLS